MTALSRIANIVAETLLRRQLNVDFQGCGRAALPADDRPQRAESAYADTKGVERSVAGWLERSPQSPAGRWAITSQLPDSP